MLPMIVDRDCLPPEPRCLGSGQHLGTTAGSRHRAAGSGSQAGDNRGQPRITLNSQLLNLTDSTLKHYKKKSYEEAVPSTSAGLILINIDIQCDQEHSSSGVSYKPFVSTNLPVVFTSSSWLLKPSTSFSSFITWLFR